MCSYAGKKPRGIRAANGALPGSVKSGAGRDLRRSGQKYRCKPMKKAYSGMCML